MKLIITLFLIALASAHFEFLHFPHIENRSEDDIKQCYPAWRQLNEFYDGIYEELGMKQTVIKDCFNHREAHLTWQSYRIFEEIARDFVDADREGVREKWEELRKIEEELWPVQQCVESHDDFWKLIEHFKFKVEDIRELDWLFVVYWQAHLNDFPIYWHHVRRLIDESRYRHAGREVARIDAEIFRNASRRHVHYEELKAFQNGIFYQLGLESPYQLSACYDEHEAKLGIRFFRLLAEEVMRHDRDEALKVTRRFFEKKGKEIWEKLRETIKCYEKTEDQRRLNERLDIDVNRDDFRKRAFEWIEKNENFYWNLMVNVDRMFERDAPLAAGMFWGEFFRCAARDEAVESFQDIDSIPFK